MNKNKDIILLPHPIFAEIVTTITYKHSKQLADKFVKFINWWHFVNFVDISKDEVSNIRLKLNQKISYFDVLIIALWLKYRVEIITFDKQLINLFNKIIKTIV